MAALIDDRYDERDDGRYDEFGWQERERDEPRDERAWSQEVGP